MTKVQDRILEHQSLNIQQLSEVAAGQGESKHSRAAKFSRDSKFFKESWICKLLFDPDTQAYEDWRILLKNELSGLRANSIYWKQLSGDLLREDVSDEIRECWYERSQQLLTVLLHSFAKTEFFELTKHVEVDETAIGITGGELAFELLDSEC